MEKRDSSEWTEATGGGWDGFIAWDVVGKQAEGFYCGLKETSKGAFGTLSLEGVTWGFSAPTVLAVLLEKVPIGAMVQITFEGVKPSTKASPIKVFKVRYRTDIAAPADDMPF